LPREAPSTWIVRRFTALSIACEIAGIISAETFLDRLRWLSEVNIWIDRAI